MPKKTLELIDKTGNFYMIQVKRNQQKLFSDLEIKLNKAKFLQHQSSEVNCKIETNKGRHERRICYTSQYQNLHWPSIKTIIAIEKYTKQIIDNQVKESISIKYFVSNQTRKADYYQDLKRKHWRIETHHYIKDITYKEDSSKIITKNSPANHSQLFSFSINTYKASGYQNQKQAIRLHSNSPKKIYNLIKTWDRVG